VKTKTFDYLTRSRRLLLTPGERGQCDKGEGVGNGNRGGGLGIARAVNLALIAAVAVV